MNSNYVCDETDVQEDKYKSSRCFLDKLPIPLRTRYLIVFIVVFLMMFGIYLTMSLHNESRQELTKVEKHRLEFVQLADQLRQTSNDLTRMARMYIFTGDIRYKQNYYTILAIRNGQISRPENYNSIYWSNVSFDYEKRIVNKPVSLQKLINDVGINEHEEKILKLSLERSNQLSKIELKAFAAMEALAMDSQGKYTLKTHIDQEYAKQLLVNDDYNQAKKAIMAPLEDFIKMVNQRTQLEYERYQTQEAKYSQISLVLVIIAAIFSIIGYVHLKRRIINPLQNLSEIAIDITQGKQPKKAIVYSEDEIGCLSKAFNKMNIRLINMISNLEKLSYIDQLTQIHNRRSFDLVFYSEWKRALRNQQSLSLLLIDIDYFKKFNDTMGHQAGDDCLTQVAAILNRNIVRAGDLLARYGGEEFAVILPNTTQENALNIAEKLRQSIHSEQIPHFSSDVSDFVSVSIGVASSVPRLRHSVNELFNLADQALYNAKSNGRNCVSDIRL